MGRYLPLFAISVEHRFFADKTCKVLDFVPTPETAALLNRTGLLTKANRNGIGVFYEDSQLDVLRSHIGDHEGGLTLGFHAFSKDAYFGQYTAPAAENADQLLRFDSRNAIAGETGVRLHDPEYVSAASFLQVEKSEYLPRPGFIVDISVSDGDCVIPAGGHQVKAKSYYLAFNARESFWKYYFFGDIAKKNIYIADLNGSVAFESAVDSTIPGKNALTFVSRAPIPMQEVPDQRFQLRTKENGIGGEKILIKRLPNASLGRIGKGMIDGKAVLFSEIFVNQ